MSPLESIPRKTSKFVSRVDPSLVTTLIHVCLGEWSHRVRPIPVDDSFGSPQRYSFFSPRLTQRTRRLPNESTSECRLHTSPFLLRPLNSCMTSKAFWVFIESISKDSPWSPYLKTLPRRFDTTLYYTEDELELFQRSPLKSLFCFSRRVPHHHLGDNNNNNHHQCFHWGARPTSWDTTKTSNRRSKSVVTTIFLDRLTPWVI